MVRILLQAYRFRYFIKHFIGPNVSSTGKTMIARLGGEFVTQTTPSYVGGEIVRIAWLRKHGIPSGTAAWVATTEIIADVFAGSLLGFISGGIALYNGGYFIGSFVILVSIPTFAFWFLILIISANRNIQLPGFSLKLIKRFLSKEKSISLINSTNGALSDLCKMSRENFTSLKTVKVFAGGIAITFIAFVFQGVSFMVLADSVGERVGLFQSFMATSAATSLSTLPVTIGGSGLAEFGIWAYISNLNGLPHLGDVLNDSQLSVIIAWRIATYHIPLVLMWICLMKITIGTNSIIRKKSKLNVGVAMQEDHDSTSTSNLSSNETNSINQPNIASNHSTSKSPSSKFPFSVYWKLDESKINNKTYKNNPNNEKE
jgi:uncharacterized protein (TIRG00374 family)